jgi:hypothetical protein
MRLPEIAKIECRCLTINSYAAKPGIRHKECVNKIPANSVIMAAKAVIVFCLDNIFLLIEAALLLMYFCQQTVQLF